ncbi:unnamed protein product [Durusdinium trenchii]|uniref:Uncharacterized protein n=1 Tax=Durusdinium trenchii TaxID=1381693 RepID=A0ABP0J7J5_9DINO
MAPGWISNINFCFTGTVASTCSATASDNNFRRVCYCDPKATTTTSTQTAGGGGDPHIYTLRGAHYSILKEGTFLAWSFSKAQVEWQLFACYAGSQFTTQGLLLLDKHSGVTIEMTAKDCTWRTKENSGWRRVHQERLSKGDSVTSLDFKEQPNRTEIHLNIKSETEKDERKVARVIAHCRPEDHLDFKLVMSEKSDIDHVGGELGSAPPQNPSFVSSSPQTMMETKTDAEFEVHDSWASLGGSESADAYLTKQRPLGPSLVSKACTKSQEEDAEKICAKHLQKEGDPWVFADCVFDVCHGGGEVDAMRAAALLEA